MKKFLVVFSIGLAFFLGSVQAHDIPREVLQFLSENPDATEEEFTAFTNTLENGEDLELWSESGNEISSFNLPPELIDFLLNNPEANEPEILEFISSDPVLSLTDWDKNIQVLLEGEGFTNGSPFSLNDLALLNQVQETFDEIYEPKNLNWFQFAKNYVKFGVQHILGGLDHVLFVMALVLLLPPWRRILLMVTAFTLAHSITLILGGTEILTLSAKIVEPIIAVSIAYVAMTTVFLSKKYPWFADQHNRLLVIFVFGLFHGLGFAGVFTESAPEAANLMPSLLFFNIVLFFCIFAILLLPGYVFFIAPGSITERFHVVVLFVISILGTIIFNKDRSFNLFSQKSNAVIQILINEKLLAQRNRFLFSFKDHKNLYLNPLRKNLGYRALSYKLSDVFSISGDTKWIENNCWGQINKINFYYGELIAKNYFPNKRNPSDISLSPRKYFLIIPNQYTGPQISFLSEQAFQQKIKLKPDLKFESIEANNQFHFKPSTEVSSLNIKKIVTPRTLIALTTFSDIDPLVSLSLSPGLSCVVFEKNPISSKENINTQIQVLISQLKKLG